MSEKLSAKYEQREAILDPERELPTAEQAEPLRPGEAEPVKQLEQARAEVAAEEERAKSEKNPIERLQNAEKAAEPPQPTFINVELKNITLRRELQQIRRKLPAPGRAMSHVIHQPAVKAVSEVAGKTISRPSGLLGGGIVAFLGSTGYLYMAKHLGFRYNYLVFILLFTGGFAVGLMLELIVWLATSSSRRANE